MPLFEEDELPAKTTDFDYALADALRKAVVDKLHIRAGWSRSAWAQQMRLLRKAVGDDEARKTVEWYCARAGAQGFPRCVNARGFRTAIFARVQELMAKDAQRNPEISAEGAALAKEVEALGWPASARAQLPACASITFATAVDFHRRLKEKVQELYDSRKRSKGKWKGQTVERVMHVPDYHPFQMVLEKFAGPRTFTRAWLRRLFHKLQMWPEPPPLTSLAWRPDSEMGRHYGAWLAYGTYNETKVWEKVLKECWQ